MAKNTINDIVSSFNTKSQTIVEDGTSYEIAVVSNSYYSTISLSAPLDMEIKDMTMPQPEGSPFSYFIKDKKIICRVTFWVKEKEPGKTLNSLIALCIANLKMAKMFMEVRNNAR